MENMVQVLLEHPMFEGIDRRLIELLAGCASNRFFKPGETITRDGAPANEFYLIRHGRVAIEMYAPGRGPITILTIEPGEALGWSWMVEPYRWHFDAHAIDPVRATVLDAKCLRTKCEEDHELGYVLLKRFIPVMESRLQATRLQLLDVYGKSAR